MRHGYTNATDQVGSLVIKTYAGPEAVRRAEVERLALTRLAGRLPVPAVLPVQSGPPGRRSSASLTAEFVPGRHGQDLIAGGFAREVLIGCGQVLRRLHSIEPTALFDHADDGVIVHGDFGPNNVLFAPASFAVAAVLDWEFCHLGDRLEDLAWCEWIVRAHHPGAVPELPSLFQSYGWTPPWTERKRFMVQRCASLEQFCRDWDAGGSGVRTWSERGRQAASWPE